MQEVTDKTKWDALHHATRTRSGHFLQSWGWGEFQEALGRRVRRYTDGNGIAQVIELALPFGGRYWYCPKGPLFGMTDDEPRAKDFFEELALKAKEAGALFIRMEPQAAVGTRTASVQPRCTSMVDVTRTEEAMLAAMHEKTRYNIRLADRHGVRAARADSADSVDAFIRLMHETARRDRFFAHPAEYYRALLRAGAELFEASHEGDVLAAAFVIYNGDTATYLHGASSSERRNVMAPYALQWAIMRNARTRGAARYDLWGIDTGDAPHWKGITRFKSGFGGETVCAPGTFDLPLRRFWYTVYRLVRKFRQVFSSRP